VKRTGHLFEEVASFENLLLAHRRARKGKRWKPYALEFEDRREEEIAALRREIEEETYRPGAYRTFRIVDPKRRWISAAPYRDRVVHHAILQIIEPVFEPTFVSDTYACRRGKGNHLALLRASYFARNSRWALKMDVRKYFPSIDHEILKGLLARKIKDERMLRLLGRVIDAPCEGEDAAWHFAGDDLFTPADRRRGIPIGNLTSQFFANVYLSPLDHFVKEALRCSRYVRYVDDFLVFDDEKRRLREVCREVERFLATRLRLRLHEEKTAAIPTRHGVNFLGFRIRPEGRRLTHAAKHRQMRRLRALRDAFARGEKSAAEVGESIRSMVAHAAWGKTTRLWRGALSRTIFSRRGGSSDGGGRGRVAAGPGTTPTIETSAPRTATATTRGT
jgi:retron-type reverse transcriptase